MATALDLITDSFIELGVIAPGEPVDPNDAALALSRLNNLLDTSNIENLLVYVEEEDLYYLAPYVQQPTIGPSGTFVATRPVSIDAANTIELANNSTNNVTGTAGTTNGAGVVLTDTSQNFSGQSIPVEPGRDLVYVSSGTGATVGVYKISAVGATTLTLTASAGASASAINYTVIVVPQRSRLDTHRDFHWWASLVSRGTTATPTDLYYAPGLSNGTLNLYPASANPLALELFVKTQLTAVAALTTTLSLAPGYYDFLMSNTALRLANAFLRTPSAMLIELARFSKAKVKALNSKAPRLTSDVPFFR